MITAIYNSTFPILKTHTYILIEHIKTDMKY